MLGYSAEIMDRRAIEAYETAVRVVSQLPEKDDKGEYLRCHEIARVVAAFLPDDIGIQIIDGFYGFVNHSWLTLLAGTYMLDCYSVGQLPPVQLRDIRTITLPVPWEYKIYRGVNAGWILNLDIINKLIEKIKESGMEAIGLKRPEEKCEHQLEPFKEVYSDEKLENLTSEEVRKKFPRRTCYKCGAIVYESYKHYLAGDW